MAPGTLKQLLELVLEILSLLIYSLYIYGEKFFRSEETQVVGRRNHLDYRCCWQRNRTSFGLAICYSFSQSQIRMLGHSTVNTLRRKRVDAHAYEMDITNRVLVTKAADNVRREVGNITVVVNNAGICPTGPFLLHEPELLEKTFAVNIFAHFWILREFLPQIIRTNRGHIVTIAPTCAMGPTNDFACYSASKHAVHGFVDALKREIRKYPTRNLKGINFTTVYPIYVEGKVMNQIKMEHRLPILMPSYLTPEYVAEKTVKGMRQNYEYLYLPPAAQLIGVLHTLLPYDAQHKLACLFDPETEYLTMDKNAVQEFLNLGKQIDIADADNSDPKSR